MKARSSTATMDHDTRAVAARLRRTGSGVRVAGPWHAVQQTPQQAMHHSASRVRQRLEAPRDTQAAAATPRLAYHMGMPEAVKAPIDTARQAKVADGRTRSYAAKAPAVGEIASPQGHDVPIAPGQFQPAPAAVMGVKALQMRSSENSAFEFPIHPAPEDGYGDRRAQTAVRRRIAEAAEAHSDRVFQRKGVRENAATQALPPVVQRKIDSGNVRDSVKNAMEKGEKRENEGEPLITTAKNIGTITPMLTKPVDDDVDSYSDSRNFQTWADNVLTRIEEGAEALAGDVNNWVGYIRKQPQIVEAEPLNLELTGAELHDRGLGVSFLDLRIVRSKSIEERMSIGSLTSPGTDVEEVRRVVLKPDDRSFEKMLLGSQDGSIAKQLNEKAGLGSNAIETVGMVTDSAHGTMVQFVEENLVSYFESWGRFLTRDKQPIVESIAFAFLTGLWDLHQENVKMRGGKPVFIDAEVGMQPRVVEKQHTLGNVLDRNAGMPGAQHDVVDRQLQGQGGRGSDLITWAKQNPNELFDILTKAIGDTSARIVPVFTGDWFYFKDRFLRYYFLSDMGTNVTERLRNAEGKKSALKEAVETIGKGRMASPGLKSQLGGNKLGETNLFLLTEQIQEDFLRGIIPEFMYQPSTGRVMHHGNVIWEGQNLSDSLSYLRERLR